MSLDKTDSQMVEELMAIKKANGNLDEKPVYVGSGESLRDKYIEPPFSVLDTKTGFWRKRKDSWLSMGIKSEVGRDATSFSTSASSKQFDYMPNVASDTSIFDPALCELMYKWFCPDGGTILDPFAGGCVRGIVAHKLGYKYTGIELRKEQVESNISQGKEILPVDNQPQWICGDSDVVLDTLPNTLADEFDMIFSCPPYFDLEIYSQDENDLSNMSYGRFVEKYKSIIHKSLSHLKNGAFAIFVVGDVRDERGYYRDFIGDTKRAFMDLYFKNDGAKLYNDIILLDPIGTAMIRAHNTFSDKKVVKVHQNVLCFKKL